MWRSLFLLPLLTGCPPGERGSTPQRDVECRKAYEQCRLPEGPLGVCNEAPCEPGQTPPCMKCLSQH